MITHHHPTSVELNCVNGAMIVTSSYNCEQNKFGRVRIEATIYDTVSGATGTSEHVIAFHRYAGNVVIDKITSVIALDTPGTLAGSTVGVSASGNTITTTFTGVAGRTIRVIGSFQLTTITNA